MTWWDAAFLTAALLVMVKVVISVAGLAPAVKLRIDAYR